MDIRSDLSWSVWWLWDCTCGATASKSHTSETMALADHVLHAYPDAPVHVPTYTPGEMGETLWECSCGKSSRVKGHNGEGRARQSHSRHRSLSLIRWREGQEQAKANREARKEREQDRWAALSPEGRERLLERELSSLI